MRSVDEQFYRYFTNEQLKKIVSMSCVVEACGFLVSTKNYMFEVDIVDGALEIYELNKIGAHLINEEFLKLLDGEEKGEVECVVVDEDGYL